MIKFADFEEVNKRMGLVDNFKRAIRIKHGFQANPSLDASLVERMQCINAF